MSVDINPSDYKILIVDDVASNVILLKALLSKEKYNLITANSGDQAIELLNTQLPDLILLDVMMRGMNGYDVATYIKNSDKYKHIPIIFLTALNSSSDIIQGFKVGGSDFVSKPFNKEELLLRIAHQISLIEAKRIIERQTVELKNIISGRDKLYSVIAHDLRSPIGTIKMALNMFSMNLTKDQVGEEMYEFINLANQTAENTFSLLDNLLKWTKSQIGRLNVVYQDVDLNDIIVDMVEVFSLISEVKSIKLNIKRIEGDSKARIDVDMIKTVLRNLLSNAVKFSNQGGEVDIYTTQDDDYINIHVKDYGVGISEENKSKLFCLGSSFSTFGTSNEEGSGLGLILVSDFVEKNGGKVWFDSKLGEGTEFSFSVPKPKII